jgi:hypothetical protein
MKFAIEHRAEGSLPTYYRLSGRGTTRGDQNQATTWDSESAAYEALRQLGLTTDPETFITRLYE